MAEKTEAQVDNRNSAYQEMATHWTLIDALMSGSQAMRDHGESYLPRETGEDPGDHATRLKRTFLYAAFEDTIDKLTGKPFSQPVTLEGEDKIDERLAELESDTDFTKSADLTSFARECFAQGMAHGHHFILVDFPQQEEGSLNLQQERELGIRPYFNSIKAPAIINWTSEIDEGGRERLTMIAIEESRAEADGEFGEIETTQIRVIRAPTWNEDIRSPGTWQVWVKPDDGNWLIDKEGTHTFPGIPLVVFYCDRTGFMTSKPPMRRLAELNLQHWQEGSDHQHMLRWVRGTTLTATGITSKEKEDGFKLGPNQLLASTNEEARFGFVEVTGGAAEASRNDLKDLEERMEVLGLQPLMERGQGKTATGRGMDEARTESQVQSWVRNLENALNQAFELAAEWLALEVSDEFAVNIFNDFGIGLKGTEDMKVLTVMYERNAISQETLLTEGKRRGLLTDTLDVAAEVETTAQRTPFVGGDPFGAESGDDEGEGDGSTD